MPVRMQEQNGRPIVRLIAVARMRPDGYWPRLGTAGRSHQVGPWRWLVRVAVLCALVAAGCTRAESPKLTVVESRAEPDAAFELSPGWRGSSVECGLRTRRDTERIEMRVRLSDGNRWRDVGYIEHVAKNVDGIHTVRLVLKRGSKTGRVHCELSSSGVGLEFVLDESDIGGIAEPIRPEEGVSVGPGEELFVGGFARDPTAIPSTSPRDALSKAETPSWAVAAYAILVPRRRAR